MAKPFWQSKTFWVNLISAVIMLLEATELTTILPPALAEEILLGIFVLNLALRWVTTGAVTASEEGARIRNIRNVGGVR